MIHVWESINVLIFILFKLDCTCNWAWKKQNVQREQCKELLLVHTINQHWAQFCLSEEERGCGLYAMWLRRMKTLGGWVWVLRMGRGPLPQTHMSTLKPNQAELHQLHKPHSPKYIKCMKKYVQIDLIATSGQWQYCIISLQAQITWEMWWWWDG